MTVIRSELYDVIVSPIYTEKATNISSTGNKYVFKVSTSASKSLIQEAIEKLFDVKVKSVNTILVKGRPRRFKGVKGNTKAYKKAIVTVDGDKRIEILGA
jgi:large subunit ribosomal protein L23